MSKRLRPLWFERFPEDEDSDGKGRIVDGLLKDRIWRRVPGFPRNEDVRASTHGDVMVRGRLRKLRPDAKGNAEVTIQNPRKSGFLSHHLVCRAFHGAAEPGDVSVDHIDRDHWNHEQSNLRWATASTQSKNRSKPKSGRSSEPCYVWEVKFDTEGKKLRQIGERVFFESAKIADSSLGLSYGAVGHILRGECTFARPKMNKNIMYSAERASPPSLLLEGEEWIQHTDTLKVSNFARVQQHHTNGSGWGWPRYTTPCKGDLYCRVRFGGQRESVHVLVGELFFVGPRPFGYTDWHHIDEDKTNNAVWNLAPVTRKVNAEECKHANERPVWVWEISNPNKKVSYKNANKAAQALGVKSGALYSVLKGYNGAKSVSAWGEKKVWYSAEYADKVE